jgi:hypothetical protein
MQLALTSSRIVDDMDDPRSFKRWLFVITGIALATRFLVLTAFWPTWFWWSGDIQDDWNKLAINSVMYGTFGYTPNESTVRRGPIFALVEIPLFLIFGEVYAAWSMFLLLLDVFTSLLLVLTGRKLWGNRVGILAGLFHAVHLPVVFYTAQIEQFSAVLPLVVLWFYLISAWDRGPSGHPHPVSLGLLSGLLILSKTVYLPVVLGSAVALGWFKRREQNTLSIVKQLTAMVVVAGLVVAPWTYRNYVVTGGSFIPVQSLFWPIVWQKFVMADLDSREGRQRPPGRTLETILARQSELIQRFGDSHTLSPTQNLSGPQRELYYDRAYRAQVLEWLRVSPRKYLANVLSNLWGFWVAAENLQKTLLMAAMQMPFLGASLVGLWLTIRHGRLDRVRFALVLVGILWAEHSLVLGWGRFSLDTVPALAIVFGVGIDAWLKHRSIRCRRGRSPTP